VAERRQAIEGFVRRLVAEVEDARAAGANTAQDVAAALNARGVTSRNGRTWTAATVAKFLASPGARRYRAGGAGR
jgi:hypothetical protein